MNSGIKNMNFFHVRNIEGQNSSEHTVSRHLENLNRKPKPKQKFRKNFQTDNPNRHSKKTTKQTFGKPKQTTQTDIRKTLPNRQSQPKQTETTQTDRDNPNRHS